MSVMKCPKCNFDNPSDSRFCGHCATPLPLEEKPPFSQTQTLQTPVEALTVGITFAGRYHIIQELGRGGMGRIYEALDRELEERVALKLIKPDIAADERIIQRFRNELKFARKIVHKNVCRMFDLNKDGETHYITMEFVPGEDLKSTVCRLGPLSMGKALNIARQICEGLAEAHRLGVIHRDLKPQNIMIDKEGNARIMDFGIARSLEVKGITEEGHVVGTMEYMSPEQVEGKKVDERSDIYSLGVIFYEMFTGRVPFEGNTPLSIATKHITAVPLEPRIVNTQIPQKLSRFIMKCLEKDKEKRFQKVDDLLLEINEIEKSMPSTEKIRLEKKRPTSLEMPRAERRQKFLIPALGITAVALVGVVVWYFVFRPDITGPAPPSSISVPKENYLESGKKYWEEKEYSEALDQFSKLLALEPDNFEAQLSLASVMHEQGRTSEAIAEFEKAMTLVSSDPRPYKSLGEIYELRQEPAKSIQYYQGYIERDPEGPDSQRIRQTIRDLETQIQALVKAEVKPVPLPPPPQIKREIPDVSADMNAGSEAFSRGEYDLCIQHMQKVLKSDPGNGAARRLLKEASEKKRVELAEKQVQDGIRAAQKALQEMDYEKCIKEAKKVLDLDKENAEAKKYLDLALMQIAPRQINVLVNEYVQAFNSKNQLSFYQAACSPDLYQKIKKEVELIANIYDNFRAAASNVNIRFRESDQAEASFSIISTGELKEDGRKQVLFEGTYIWDMERQGDSWKIVRITAKPLEKKQTKKEDT